MGSPRKKLGVFPEPRGIGAPDRFREWRPYQEQAIWDLSNSLKRFSALVAPTGAGKSLTYLSLALLAEGRVLVLTNTKGLQDQILRDFEEMGMVDVRGQSNYLCALEPLGDVTVDKGICHVGVQCELRRDGGCSYWDQVRKAGASKIVITNYDLWLSSKAHDSESNKLLGEFDLLVLDEAHKAEGKLSDVLSVKISDFECRGLNLPTPTEGRWREWAEAAAKEVEWRIEQLRPSTGSPAKAPSRHQAGLMLQLREMKRKLSRLFDMVKGQGINNSDGTGWVVERQGRVVRWDPTTPAGWAEDYLFQGVKRVILASATVRAKTLELLGLGAGDYDLFEYPSTFAIERRRVFYFDDAEAGGLSIRLNNRTEQDSGLVTMWVARMDQIIKARPGVKGIIHAVSYGRARLIASKSRFSDRMIVHDSGNEALQRAIQDLRDGPKDRILVTPAATEGLDFPYDDCRFQIIAKVPFPDMRSQVLRARCKTDGDYPQYLAFMNIVQATGRGMRAADDWCETFVADDNFGWFCWRYQKFAPKWFLDAVVKIGSTKLPAAPVLPNATWRL